MSKLFLLAIIALAITGIFTGAIEVKINPSKLGNLPTAIGQAVGDGNIVSQAEYYFTTWKRKAEIAIPNSDDKKFDLYMKYVEQDTKTLQEALDAKKGPETIIIKSRLLNESLEAAKKAVEDISDEAIAKVRDAWLKVLAGANQQLGRLAGLADEYKKYQEKIEKIVPTATPDSKASPTPKIELKF